MEPTWKHHEIFPIIAHVIERQYRGDEQYIPAHEIAAELLRDPEAMAIITAHMNNVLRTNIFLQSSQRSIERDCEDRNKAKRPDF